MTLDADIIIVGGGCAGLSLGVALAERAPTLKVHTLEGRTGYERDRTWCFWDTAQHPFAAGVTHRWDSWRVRHNGCEARQQSRRYSYQHLPADRFYDLATNRTEQAGQALTMGANVQRIQQVGSRCEVETDLGLLRSRWVFDSRPPGPDTAQPVLTQRFVGWHVRCDRPCFDTSVVDLMDFQQGVEGRVTFFYVLPFSATEALVEATFLENPALPPIDGEALLRVHLQQLCRGTYEVCYRESASLPMGDRRPTTDRRPRTSSNECVVAIGTRGGRVKPSSGYAFLRIQRQSAALAGALGRGASLPRHVEPRFYALLDRIFLEALRRAPRHTASYFFRLFEKVPPDTLVRFLSETASPGEVLRVMLALPKSDFLEAALMPKAGGRLA